MIYRCKQLPPGLTNLSQQQWFQDWHGKLIIEGDLTKLLEDLSSRHGFAVSNGSFHPGHGTTAWILKGLSSVNQVVARLMASGNSMDHSMFYSKLSGLLGIFATLLQLQLTQNWLALLSNCLQQEVSSGENAIRVPQWTQRSHMQIKLCPVRIWFGSALTNWFGTTLKDTKMVRSPWFSHGMLGWISTQTILIGSVWAQQLSCMDPWTTICLVANGCFMFRGTKL